MMSNISSLAGFAALLSAKEGPLGSADATHLLQDGAALPAHTPPSNEPICVRSARVPGESRLT